jgi:acetyltransferase-like isoleucine patch superfamily enzyme
MLGCATTFMRRITVHKCRGNSLHGWHRARNPLRVCINFLLIYAARYAPSLSLKRFLLRAAGARVAPGAAFGLGATIDIFFPENIEVGQDAIIGYNTVLLGHEFLQGQYRTGRVEIGERAMLGANCTVLPGVKVGSDASVSAMSLVNRDIPAGEKWGGVPARRLAGASGDGGGVPVKRLAPARGNGRSVPARKIKG